MSAAVSLVALSRCLHNESHSVAGTVHGDDIFSLVLARILRIWERHSRRDGKLVTRCLDPSLVTRKNSTSSIVRCNGARVGWSLQRICDMVELGLSKSKPVSSPATLDGATRCQGDELKPLDEEGKRLYQRIVAKLNYPAHDRLDLKYATSCLASAVPSPCLETCKRRSELDAT